MNLQSFVQERFVWDEDKQDFVSIKEETYFSNGEPVSREDYYSLLDEWQEQAVLLSEDEEDSNDVVLPGSTLHYAIR